jgi:hypothetical protein
MRAATTKRFHASFGLTRDVASSGRCQIRGGLKGGLPVCEENGLAANKAVIFAKVEGNTIFDDDVPVKLKHLSTQVAMAAQSSMAFSHGFPLCGQHSVISSIMDMSAGSGDLTLTPAASAVGSIATDKAIRNARMVRPMLMDQVK